MGKNSSILDLTCNSFEKLKFLFFVAAPIGDGREFWLKNLSEESDRKTKDTNIQIHQNEHNVELYLAASQWIRINNSE